MKTGTNHRGAENKLQNKSPITQNWGPRQKFNKYIVKIIKEQKKKYTIHVLFMEYCSIINYLSMHIIVPS